MSGFTVNVMGAGETTTCIDTSLIDPSVLCTEIFEPVCGCDGVTYSNSCWATNSAGLTSWEDGPCQIDVVENRKWSENLKVYPNPISGDQLQFKGVDLFQGEFTAKLISLTGQCFSLDVSSAESINGQLTIPLEGLTSGIYLLRIGHEGTWITRKLIIR